MFRVCECGTVFVKRKGKKRCAVCQEKRTRVKARQQNYLRRVKTTGRQVEQIDIIEVASAAGWICGICGNEVERALRWPNPGAMSLDHILPISQGGAHARENVQLAHLLCNWSKGKGPHHVSDFENEIGQRQSQN